MLVAWVVAVTERPGIAAPDSSETMPVTVARPVCPMTVVGRTRAASATRLACRKRFKSLRIEHSFPPDVGCGCVLQKRRGVYRLVETLVASPNRLKHALK